LQQGYVDGGQAMVQTAFPGSVSPVATVYSNPTLNAGGTESVIPVEAKMQEAFPGTDGDLPPSYANSAVTPSS